MDSNVDILKKQDWRFQSSYLSAHYDFCVGSSFDKKNIRQKVYFQYSFGIANSKT